MLTYELKAALLLGVFYGLYALLMRRDTLFRQRRLALLASVILSALLPLCQIEWHVEEIISPEAAGNLPVISDNAAEEPMSDGIWTHYATIAATSLLFLGMAVMAIRSIKELVSLQRFIRQHRSHKTSDGTTIVVSNHPTRPFSYLNYIVMSEADFERNHDALIMHEQAHIRHHHTIDLFLMNLLLTLQWFNPVAWKLRKELTMVHEYEADEDVLNAGINSTDYIQLLISKATGRGRFSLANTLSEKRMLRQRVEMLARRRTTKWAKLKTLSLLPVIALSLGMSAKVVKDYTYLEQPTALQSQNGQEKNKRTQQKDRQTAPAGKAGEQTADNTKKTHTVDDDSVEYKVNGIQVAKPDVDNINPDKIKQVTIIKSPQPTDDTTDSPHKRIVYVDMNDTIIKQVDDNTYILFDSQKDYEEFKQQSNDIALDIEHARSEAKATQAKAQKEANAARDKANEARAKLHRDTEKLRKDADKRRKSALEKTAKAREYAEQAKAYKNKMKAQMEQDMEAIAMLQSFNQADSDSTSIRLTVENDGIVSNITAYQTDTTSNETNLMLICKKEGQDLIVIYKRI